MFKKVFTHLVVGTVGLVIGVIKHEQVAAFAKNVASKVTARCTCQEEVPPAE